MRPRHSAAVLGLILLSACTTESESKPPRTAVEELLISAAAEKAADCLTLHIPKDSPVFIDASNFEGTDSKYAVSSIRDSLLRQGVAVVDDKKNAKAVVEIRSGALSMEQKDTLVGIQSFNIPVPFATAPLTFPEIAFYKAVTREGVAKFALTAYDSKTGELVQSIKPQFGFSDYTKRNLLVFFSWTSNDILPDPKHSIVSQKIDSISYMEASPIVPVCESLKGKAAFDTHLDVLK